MLIPDYLKAPTLQGHIYGTLEYNEGAGVFLIDGEPLVTEFAKRLFPGSIRCGRGRIGMKYSKRVISDLHWLLMRFPLDIKCREFLNDCRLETINAINRRVSGHDLKQTVPPSEFTGKLMGFQEEAVTFLNTNRRVVLGDEMGLGKTWSALGAAAKAAKYPVLVVCQTHTQRQWQRVIGSLFDMGEFQMPLDKDPFTVACRRGEKIAPILKSRSPYKIPDTPFSIIHYGLLQDWGKSLRDRGYPIVIFDEVQELRHIGTKKYSEASLMSSDAQYVWGLSGTPVYGYGVEIWSVMNAVDFQCLGSQDVFTREWCTGYGDKIVENPKALNDLLVREGLLLRRKYKDENVAVALPMVDRKVIDVAHDTDLYDSLIDTAQKSAGMYNVASFTEKGRIARDIERRTRMASGIAKAGFAGDFIASLIEAGEKPLVYAWHHMVHDALVEKLSGFKPAFITGKQSEKQKDNALRAFSRGDTDVVILSLRSAAGLDGLQKRATCCVFVELDWSPAIHCFDEKTEVLTPDGFVGVDGVGEGSLVAAFDVETSEIRWLKANAKVDRVLGVGEKVFTSETKKISMAVTGDHRMVYRSLVRGNDGNKKSEWKVDTAENLCGKKRRYVPVCGFQKSGGVELSDSELSLIGLFVSDGHFDKNGLVIYQSADQPWNKDIVDILDGAGMEWRVWERDYRGKKMNWYSVLSGFRAKVGSDVRGPVVGWRKIEKYLDKDLSPLLDECTRSQLEHLIHGMWIGDGTKNDLSVKRITNTNKRMLDRLQSLCVRRGIPARISERKERTSAGNLVYDISIGGNEDVYLQDSHCRGERFDSDKSFVCGDRVWCLSNDLGTLVTRRNGKVVVTGNSQCETRIARIGVDEILEEIPSYYCVSSTSFDEIIMDVLGVKKGQFVGLMGDEPEDSKEKKAAEERAERRIKTLVAKLTEGQVVEQ